MPPKSPSLLQGTLDLIVLQLLRAEPTNGYELAQRIQAISATSSRSTPARSIHRCTGSKRVTSFVPNGMSRRRPAREGVFADAAGRKQLADHREEWTRFAGALAAILKT
jgi:DNA-binding PadR family transcriptional regulator